jgi:hypothetical protein
MSNSLLNSLFEPPKLEIGDHVTRRDPDNLPRRYRGTIVSVGGWYAVVQWTGLAKARREYIPDLQRESIQEIR